MLCATYVLGDEGYKKNRASFLVFFVSLVVSGLRCGTWDLTHVMQNLLLQCTDSLQLWYAGIVAPWHVGSSFPDQGLNTRPLHHQADS